MKRLKPGNCVINGMQVSSHRGGCIPGAAIGQGLDNVFVFSDNLQSVSWYSVCQMPDAIPNRLHALHCCPHAFEQGCPCNELVKSLVVEEEKPTVTRFGMIGLLVKIKPSFY